MGSEVYAVAILAGDIAEIGIQKREAVIVVY